MACLFGLSISLAVFAQELYNSSVCMCVACECTHVCACVCLRTRVCVPELSSYMLFSFFVLLSPPPSLEIHSALFYNKRQSPALSCVCTPGLSDHKPSPYHRPAYRSAALETRKPDSPSGRSVGRCLWAWRWAPQPSLQRLPRVRVMTLILSK